MPKKIIYANDIGGVSVVTPAPQFENRLEDVIRKSVPDGVEATIINDTELPASRKFRNAWEYRSQAININADKCRNIIRSKRNLSLMELDKIALREQRKPAGDMTTVDAEAQRLRDIPQQQTFSSSNINELELLLDDCELKENVRSL